MAVIITSILSTRDLGTSQWPRQRKGVVRTMRKATKELPDTGAPTPASQAPMPDGGQDLLADGGCYKLSRDGSEERGWPPAREEEEELVGCTDFPAIEVEPCFFSSQASQLRREATHLPCDLGQTPPLFGTWFPSL